MDGYLAQSCMAKKWVNEKLDCLAPESVLSPVFPTLFIPGNCEEDQGG